MFADQYMIRDVHSVQSTETSLGKKKNKKKTGHTLIFPAASSKASLCSEAFRWVYNEKNIKSQGQKNTNNHKHVEASTMNPETSSFCHKQHNKYIWK